MLVTNFNFRNLKNTEVRNMVHNFRKKERERTPTLLVWIKSQEFVIILGILHICMYICKCVYANIYMYRIAFSFPLSLQILRKLASAMTQKILGREEFWLVLFSVSSVACFWFQAECVLCSGGCPTSSLLQPNLQVLLPSQPSSCKTIALFYLTPYTLLFRSLLYLAQSPLSFT